MGSSGIPSLLASRRIGGKRSNACIWSSEDKASSRTQTSSKVSNSPPSQWRASNAAIFSGVRNAVKYSSHVCGSVGQSSSTSPSPSLSIWSPQISSGGGGGGVLGGWLGFSWTNFTSGNVCCAVNAAAFSSRILTPYINRDKLVTASACLRCRLVLLVRRYTFRCYSRDRRYHK